MGNGSLSNDPFPRPQILGSNFQSLLSSQRYKLMLSVQIVEPRRIFFRLSLPVQIAYQTVEDRIFVEVQHIEPPPYVGGTSLKALNRHW